jgi:RNA polymerase sigma-70 factor, ECF subfamily
MTVGSSSNVSDARQRNNAASCRCIKAWIATSNQPPPGGVLPHDERPAVMRERVVELPDTLVSTDADLEREFEARLAESATLAFRVAYAVLRHRQDAEDIAQEAFVRAHRGFRQLRDRDRFRAWLARLTWRLALDRRRTERRRAIRDAAHPPAAPPESMADDEIASRERADLLWRAIDALPEKLRVVVVLSAIQEHDLHEVAGLLGIAEGTVKSRLFAARSRLKEWLQCATTPRNT